MTDRGSFVVLAAVGLVLHGCGGENAPERRRIVPHSLAACKVAGDPTLLVTALGDFGASRASGAVTAKGSSALDLPQDLLGVEVQVLPRVDSGIGYASPPDDVHVTLWPFDDGCDAADIDVPASRGGGAMTSFRDGSALLVAGLEPVDTLRPNLAAFALAIDLSTGEKMKGSATGLPAGRAFGSATPFGKGALVAGGIDLTDPSQPSWQKPEHTAFVFSGEQFESARIELGSARAHHGAVVLASGETLLVGGTGDGSTVLDSMVAIDPATGNTRVFDVGPLRQPRSDPVVLRLSNDQILVAGGTDRNGQPVSTLEWFASDGSRCSPPDCPDVNSTLPSTRRNVAFVTLPAGGALAAGGFDPPVAPTLDELPARDVWWITPQGSAERLEPLAAEQRPLGKLLRLVAASDGAPWAWTGNTWLRFEPWEARFFAPAEAPLDGPDDTAPDPVAIDPGLFVWLSPSTAGARGMPTRVRGFRHGVRGRLTRDPAPLLFADAAHLAPDRPPRRGLIEFDGVDLHLARSTDSGTPRVVVTDTLYGDFDLTAAASTSGVLPEVVVGGSIVGPAPCTWPSNGVGASFSVRRRGSALEIEVVGDTRTVTRSCSGPQGRVAIALRAPLFGEAIVRKLMIARP